jgi:hypothetical protein
MWAKVGKTYSPLQQFFLFNTSIKRAKKKKTNTKYKTVRLGSHVLSRKCLVTAVYGVRLAYLVSYVVNYLSVV